MKPLSAEQLRSSFANCSKGETKRLSPPDSLEGIRWDNLDFLGWRDPKSPNNAYLIAPHPGVDDDPVGIVLRISKPDGVRRKNMCTLCWTTHPAADMALMVAPLAGAAGRNGNTVGNYICADLACSLYARGLKRPVHAQPEETLSVDQKVERLQRNVATFVQRVITPR